MVDPSLETRNGQGFCDIGSSKSIFISFFDHEDRSEVA
jgi:hypothetical protein